MKQHEPFEPKLRKNLLLGVTTYLFAAAVMLLWKFHDRLGVEISTVCILTGIALLMIILDIVGRKNRTENYRYAKELKDSREKMSDEDFRGSAVFFENDDK
ncbi:MAG: hypothetical protein ACI4JJ_00600 [Huintestinicola sp.]